jgi:hypothetical protein
MGGSNILIVLLDNDDRHLDIKKILLDANMHPPCIFFYITINHLNNSRIRLYGTRASSRDLPFADFQDGSQ